MRLKYIHGVFHLSAVALPTTLPHPWQRWQSDLLSCNLHLPGLEIETAPPRSLCQHLHQGLGDGGGYLPFLPCDAAIDAIGINGRSGEGSM